MRYVPILIPRVSFFGSISFSLIFLIISLASSINIWMVASLHSKWEQSPWPNTPWIACDCSTRRQHPLQRRLLACVSSDVLALKVVLVADQDYAKILVGVVLGLLNPFGQVIKGFPVGNVVHEDGSDRASVVRACDWLKNFLTGLTKFVGTVSQICSLMRSSARSMTLDPNYTPTVVSASTLNLLSKNCINTHDFPTPVWDSRYLHHRWWCTWASMSNYSFYYSAILLHHYVDSHW